MTAPTKRPVTTIAVLAEALWLARVKLRFYRQQTGGEYLGGSEYSQLMKRIDEALALARLQEGHG